MGKSRFLPEELRNKIIDRLLTSTDKLDVPLITAISDNWTDTKLIKVLDQRMAIFKLAGLNTTVEIKVMEDLQEEIAEYVLLEELSGKKNSGN